MGIIIFQKDFHCVSKELGFNFDNLYGFLHVVDEIRFQTRKGQPKCLYHHATQGALYYMARIDIKQVH